MVSLAGHKHDAQAGARGAPAKLVLWAGSFEAAGTQRFLLEFLRRMDRDRFTPTVFSTLATGELLPEIEAAGAQVHEFGTGRGVMSPRTAGDLTRAARFLRREKVDVLSCMLGITTLVGPFVGRAAGVPVVVNNQRNQSYWLRGGVKESVYGFVSRRMVDAVIVNSDAAVHELTERFRVPESKVEHVGVGTDLSRIAEASPDPDFARSVGLEGKKLVGIVAKLSYVKGHDLFLDAAAVVSKVRDDVGFVIVGDGADREKLERRTSELGLADCVRFVGVRDDVPSILKALDVFVLSSRSEGSPNVILEAMAAGVPVVATRVGGVPELVEEGTTGFLVGRGDAPELATAVLTLLGDEDRARTMGEAAGRHAVEHYGIDAVVRRMEDVFGGLLERTGGGA